MNKKILIHKIFLVFSLVFCVGLISLTSVLSADMEYNNGNLIVPGSVGIGTF